MPEEQYINQKMNVRMKKEDYERWKNGELHLNHGFRNDDGTISSIPEMEEIFEEERNSEQEKEASWAEIGICFALMAGIAILAKEENYQKIKKCWLERLLPGIQYTASCVSDKTNQAVTGIKMFLGKKNKIKKQDVNIAYPDEIVLDSNEEWNIYRKYMSKQEAQIKQQEIALLAAYLANKIKEFANAYVEEDLTSEELLLRQNKLKALYSQEIRSKIQLLVEKDNLLLSPELNSFFQEYLQGNIYLKNKVLSLETLEIKEK